jgi:hypothetical protein
MFLAGLGRFAPRSAILRAILLLLGVGDSRKLMLPRASPLAGKDIHWHTSGLVACAGIDPLNFLAAIEEVLNIALQVILRLYGVVGVRKKAEWPPGFSFCGLRRCR